MQGSPSQAVQARLALIDGTSGGGVAAAAALEAAGAKVLSLHWRSDLQAILPGFRGGSEGSLGAGSSDLRGDWALLLYASIADTAEAMQIGEEAHALGLRLALWIERGHMLGEADLVAIASSDLVLFATEAEKNAALDAMHRRTFPAAAFPPFANSSAEVLAAIADERSFPRINRMTPPPGRIFYWTGLTATQPFNSGVQRVTRALGKALHRLNIQVVPVKWDTGSERITLLDEARVCHLAKFDGPLISSTEPLPTDLTDEWLLLPEITVPVAPPGSNAIRLARSLGMRIAAIFYDLIPAKMPELYQAATMDEFAAYWDAFAEADLALPISWTAAADLCRYLTKRELRVPQVVPCTLAGDLSGHTRQRTPRQPPEPGEPLRLLAVGTWEPRKNYPRLLRAIGEARLLAPERPIRLTIVGLPRRVGRACRGDRTLGGRSRRHRLA